MSNPLLLLSGEMLQGAGRVGRKYGPARWVVLLAPAIVVAALFVWRHQVGVRGARVRSGTAMDDLFSTLRQRGFEPNQLFAGRLLPGTILQVRELGADGTPRPLAPPLVMFWPSQCFPGLVSSSTPIALETRSGSSIERLSLSGDLARALLPSLAVDHQAVAEYTLVLGPTELVSVAKGNISDQLAHECVDRLAMQIGHGAEHDWFAVIVESIVTRKVSYEVTWSSTASADAKVSFLKQIESGLGQLTGAGGEPGGKSMVGSDDTEKTVMGAEGALVLAYRARPLEPLYARVGEAKP